MTASPELPPEPARADRSRPRSSRFDAGRQGHPREGGEHALRYQVAAAVVIWACAVAFALDLAAISRAVASQCVPPILRGLPLLALAGYVSAPALRRSLSSARTCIDEAALAIAWNVAFGVLFAALFGVAGLVGLHGASASLGAERNALAALVRLAFTPTFAVSMLPVLALSTCAVRCLRRRCSSGPSAAAAPTCSAASSAPGWLSSFSLVAFVAGGVWSLVSAAVLSVSGEISTEPEVQLPLVQNFAIYAIALGLVSVPVARLLRDSFWPGRSWRAYLLVGVGLAGLRAICATALLVLVVAAPHAGNPLQWIAWAGASLWWLGIFVLVGSMWGLAADPLAIVGMATLVSSLALLEASWLTQVARAVPPRAGSRRGLAP